VESLLRPCTRAALAIAIGWLSIASSAELAPDTDSDGVPDALDKCRFDPRNTGHASCDADCDGYGNVCDADFDQNASVSAVDFSRYFVPSFATGIPSPHGTDMNCDGTVNSVDFDRFFVPSFMLGHPGPSGLPCAGQPGCGC
jgi:hypothetical protein